MDMRCAYGTLEFRAVDDAQRILEGVASTDMLDDFGTILDPAGARFSLPIPLLWMHDKHSPVGEVVSAEVVGNQLRVRAQIRKIDEPGPVKDLVDRAWQNVKHKLVRGFSVGFLPLKQVKNRFTEWGWRELSLVTIPANSQATIQLVRSISSPGVSGTPNDSTNPRPKMTIREQIQQHENSRAAKVARQSALMERAAADGSTLAPDEAEEYDTLTGEIEAIDGHIARLSVLERSQVARATPVPATPGVQPAAQARGGVPIVQVRSNELPGLAYARYAMALLACRGNRFEAAEYAKGAWGDGADLVVAQLRMQNRAAIAAGDTADSTWAAPLKPTTPMASEFLELLRPMTLLGKIQGLKKVPFDISLPRQTGGGTYGWVGESKAKGLTKLAFDTLTIGRAKVAGIIVLTEELVRSSSPDAQQLVRDDMLKGIATFLDEQFVDPTKAVDGVVSPASITNGVTGNVSTGSTEAQVKADLLLLIGPFTENNYGLGSVVVLMSEGNAYALANILNAVGGSAFPNIGVNGGTLPGGVQVVTSNSVGDQIVGVHTPSILFADEGGIEIDVSREASVQMDSEPAEPTAAGTVMVSLWQRNMVGLRAERFINWKKGRTTAVRRITDVDYIPSDAS